MWELDHKEIQAPKNWCIWTVVLEKTLEIKPVSPKGNQPWIFLGRTDAKAKAPILWPPDAKSRLIGKDPTHWKRPWCWERLMAGGEGDNRGWDGWMASPTQRIWVWVGSRRWWRTGKPGMLQSMGSQRIGHNWVTGQQLTDHAQIPGLALGWASFGPGLWQNVRKVLGVVNAS